MTSFFGNLLNILNKYSLLDFYFRKCAETGFCYLLTCMYLPITVVYGLDTGRTLPDEVYFVGVVFLWLSPSVNWVVYGLTNAKFARAYRHLLCGGEKFSTAAAAAAAAGDSCKQRRSPTPKPVVVSRPKAACHATTDSLCRRGHDLLIR